MKKAYLVLLTFFFFTTLEGFSQSNTIAKRSKNSISQNDSKLTPKQLLALTKSNPEAYKEAIIAKGNYNIGTVFQYPGGFLIGYPIGTAISGGQPNWTLAIAGAGFIMLSIPFHIAYTKHANKAVNIYNDGLRQNTADFKLGFSPGRVELKLMF